MTQVLLQRLEPGRYAVALAGEQSVEETPLLVVRHRTSRTSKAWGRYSGLDVTEAWWQVEFDSKTMLSVIGEWKRERIGGTENWEHQFGWEGFDTLREARLKLEEVLDGARDTGGSALAGDHGGDAGGGA